MLKMLRQSRHGSRSALRLASTRQPRLSSITRSLSTLEGSTSSGEPSITPNDPSLTSTKDAQEDDQIDLMTPAPLYDAVYRKRLGRNSTRGGYVNLYNSPSLVKYMNREDKNAGADNESKATEEDPTKYLAIPRSEWGKLHKYPLITRSVTQQTGKGKIQRMYQLVVVGNGRGLVGCGEGKHADMERAARKAFIEAVRNMDYVERFEERTIWTDMETKFGSTRIQMRPRPVGFGLHCNPHIHQVLKAAGIKDISAKVHGSRNPANVIKATLRMIHAGSAPLGMGDGLGEGGKRTSAGAGMRGKVAVEIERGRKLIDGRTW